MIDVWIYPDKPQFTRLDYWLWLGFSILGVYFGISIGVTGFNAFLYGATLFLSIISLFGLKLPYYLIEKVDENGVYDARLYRPSDYIDGPYLPYGTIISGPYFAEELELLKADLGED